MPAAGDGRAAAGAAVSAAGEEETAAAAADEVEMASLVYRHPRSLTWQEQHAWCRLHFFPEDVARAVSDCRMSGEEFACLSEQRMAEIGIALFGARRRLTLRIRAAAARARV